MASKSLARRCMVVAALLAVVCAVLGGDAGVGGVEADDRAATDPVCRFSPYHDRVAAAREAVGAEEFLYRTMKRPRVPS